MKRLLVHSFLLLVLVSACSSAERIAPPKPTPSDAMGIDIDLWTNKGDRAVYRTGEALEVYFRASNDCFLTLYDISTDGAVRVLFPQYPDDGFVYGGVTYRLPDYYRGGVLRVDGPRGIEYLHAVASEEPSAFRFRTRVNQYFLDVDPVSGDPYLAINAINERIIPSRLISATATTSFFVGGLVWYPRYTCRGCHAGPMPLDPYADVCSRYSVVVAHNAEYWWDHEYHPVMAHFAFATPFWRFEIRTGPYRPHRHRYIDCAWGFGNYHPVVIPSRRWVAVERKSPRMETHRSYEREYRPYTFDDRSRDYGRQRTLQSGSIERSRSADTDRTRGSEASRSASTAPVERTRGSEASRSASTAPVERTRSSEASRSASTAPVERTRSGEASRSASTAPVERSRGEQNAQRERSAPADSRQRSR